MSQYRKEQWRDEYLSYVTLSSKIHKLRKMIHSLNARLDMYLEKRDEVKLARGEYERRWRRANRNKKK